MTHLVVVHAFPPYAKGAPITDAGTIAAILAGPNSTLVVAVDDVGASPATAAPQSSPLLSVSTAATAAPTFVSLTAGAPLGGQRALMLRDDGTVVYADPETPDYLFAGISTATATAGSTLRAAMAGLITEPSWDWSACAKVFVGPAGALTEQPPTAGWMHLIGVAVAPTALLIAPATPVLLAP